MLKKKPRPLKAYPSVAQMVADTSPPRAAIKFLADTVHDLQTRVRRLELKTAILGDDPLIVALGTPGKPASPKELEKLRGLMGKVARKKLGRKA